MKKKLETIAKELGLLLLNWRKTEAISGGWEGTQFKAMADVMAHDYLVGKLKMLTPDVPVLSEEDESSLTLERPAKYWLIDPIDGTASYVGGFDGYVTQIVLIEFDKPILSVICAPSLSLMYSAEKGMGAYLNGVKLDSLNERSSRILIDNYPKPQGIAKDVFNALSCTDYMESGSLGLKLVRVADGSADLFIKDVAVKDWDLAPADLILSEVGGILTDISGESIVYTGSYDINGIACCRDVDLDSQFRLWYSSK